jgi:hypothetical protein
MLKATPAVGRICKQKARPARISPRSTSEDRANCGVRWCHGVREYGSRVAAEGDRPACILLIGEGRLADATERALDAGQASVRRLREPTDRDIREALGDEIDLVVVISRFDHVSLRMALAVDHVRPGVPQLVTVFDRDVATHLRETVEHAQALSMADIVVPAFAGPVLDPELLSIVSGATGLEGVKAIDDEPRHVPRSWPVPGRVGRLLANLEALARPFDSSARILVVGLAGFLGVIVLETAVTMLEAGVSLVDALYSVSKVTVTVGPSQYADEGATWFKLFSAVTMLVTLGFAAVLTAGLVNRLLDPRLTGIVGRKAVPRRGHVVVVGLGQVGFRLAMLLREIGMPVVVVEQNEGAKNVTRAKDERLPVVIGSGASQAVLRRLSIDRARGVAAVTSDEVENIAVAVAARGVRDGLNITLRAGDGDETSEIESLFQLGVVRDIYRIAGSTLAAVALGYDVHAGFPYEGTLFLVDRQGDIHPFAPGARGEAAVERDA